MAQATDDKVNSSPVKIVGADNTTQAETNIANVSAGGGVYTNLRNDAGTEVGTPTSPLNVRGGVDQVIITTATPLGANAAFTSSIIDFTTLAGGAEVTINLFADQASAASGLQIQWSPDGTNFDQVESYLNLTAMTAGGGKTFTQRKVNRYLRIIFTNGAIAQTAFRLTVILNNDSAKPSSHRIGTQIDDNNDAQLTKANLIARRSDGTHDNVKSTLNNDLQTADIADQGGVSGVIAVANTAIAIRVGASNLANRKRLAFVNVGSSTMYWGYTNAVTGAGNGNPIFRNQPVSDSWGPNTTIWIIAPTGSGSLWVGEGA